MKKIIQTFKNYHPCKPLAMLFLFLPFIAGEVIFRILDNDFWFLISLGRQIVSKGIPWIEPLTLHQGLSFVAQQWLTDVIFYSIYRSIGQIGMILLLMVATALITYLLYRLTMLVSERKLYLSIFITVITLFLLLLSYIRTRPQIFDFILFLLELLALESYLRTKEKKYLFLLPILSILLINLHCSSWFLLFCFFLPYLIDACQFHLGPIKSEGAPKLPLFISGIAMLLGGLINPYHIKAITYLLTSYGNPVVNKIVGEMHPMFQSGPYCTIVFLLSVCLLGYTYWKHFDKIKVRYLLLQLGTIVLATSNVKGYSFFLVGGVFPFAYYFKDAFSTYQDQYLYTKDFYFKYGLLVCCLFFFPTLISSLLPQSYFDSINTRKIWAYLEANTNKKDVILYTNYDTGSFYEWHQYRVYLDARAEVFLKANNQKEDILYEYDALQTGRLNPQDFLNRYAFTHLIVHQKNQNLFLYLKKNKDYRMVLKEKAKTNKKLTYYLFEKVSSS